MATMANYWSSKGREVFLVTFDDGSTPPFYPLAAEVKHIPLNILGVSSNSGMGLLNNVKRIWVLRKTIRHVSPDIILSFIDLTNVLVILASLGLKLPVLVAEHSDPAMTVISPLWKRMRSWTYPRADQTVVLNQKAKGYFPARIQERTTIIPNPVLLEGDENGVDEIFSGSVVVAMGRLTEEKRIEDLLRAFALLKDQYSEWNLKIMGDGPLRSELEFLRDRLGLQQRVDFLGVVKDPHSVLRRTDLFVLPSRFEGFPLALCEAMACGLPVISTEYHGGVRDIIDDGVNGVLVPVGDINTLSIAMNRLMGDEIERKRLGAKAVDILHQFGLEKIMGIWEELIEQAVFEKKR
jgi:GalNAc-alpha-(1->4)-GalNAc-alpha-(1->3)-diNAcBac-PP-undecaprenol alpha-1,4-N-acetyl-D-galactosaminyltransferase